MQHQKKNEKGGKWSTGGKGVKVVRQGGIDLLALNKGTRQVLSAHTPLKSVFSLISLIWEKQPDSLPQSLGWVCLLPQVPRSVFSLTFDFRPTKFIAFLAPVPSKIVVGRARVGGLWCCIGGSRVK